MKIRPLIPCHWLSIVLLLGCWLGISSSVLAEVLQTNENNKHALTAKQTPWQQLEQTHWVQDGNAQAPRIVYMFSDPQCTYCFAFRRAIADKIASGKIQLRHIMVGLLTEKSHPQAATILGSPQPAQAYQEHHKNLKQGGIRVDALAVAKASQRVTENTHLMVPMRTISTPTIFYKNAQGVLQIVYGFPDDEALAKLTEVDN